MTRVGPNPGLRDHRAADLRLSLRVFASLFLFFAAAALYFIERSSMGNWSLWAHLLGLAAALVYLWIFLRAEQAVVLTSFFQIYYLIGMMVSAMTIGAGAYMIEIGKYGTPNGIFWILVIYLVIGLEATRLGYRFAARVRFGGGMLPPSPAANRAVIWLFIAVTLGMAIVVSLLTGGPILRGVDRVTFYKTIAPPGTAILPSLVTQTFFFAAYLYLWTLQRSGSMTVPRAVLIAYLLTGVLVLGEKFSLFMAFINVWLVMAPGLVGRIIWRKGHVLMAFAAVVLILFGVAVAYLTEGRDVGFILVRAALQAQLLWSVFNDTHILSLAPIDPDCYIGCPPFASGREYISFRYLPTSLYYFYDGAGNVVSGFMPSLSILTLGFSLSILIHMAVSFLLGVVQQRLTATLSEGNLVMGFLLFKVQFGLVFLWTVSTFAPLRGLIVTLLLMAAYRLAFARRSGMAPPVHAKVA